VRRRRFRDLLKWGVLGLLALLVLIQLVPYGRDHTNPSGGKRIAWDSPRTEKLMTESCLDCHSNMTTWPWYSNVAPVSWLVQHDVDDGRRRMNLSTGSARVDDMVREVQSGGMPPWQYKLIHGGARLSAKDKQDLIRGIQATFGPGSGP
jgi:hypothetical protein